MRAGSVVEAAARQREDAARERLGWLVGLCMLPPRSAALLALLIGLGSDEPALSWWPTDALAMRLGVEETIVTAALEPSEPLVQWGLVRRSGACVAVNLRIARFLIG